MLQPPLLRRGMSMYHALGVAPSCTNAELKLAYRAAAKRHHPDINPDAEPQTFARIATAFDTLSCPVLRKEHDTKHGIVNVAELYSGQVREEDLAALRAQEDALAAAAEGQRLAEARYAASGGGSAKRRSRKRPQMTGDWWDVPNMRGVHDAGYGFTANLE